ncbi:MAG TPA: DUF3854 domain-containing protein [Chloroflexota bacterium]|nr:DUF3854 domain-containing protein [Chloroflexota bacterium]
MRDVLTPEHWHELTVESAILPEIIAEEGIRSLAGSHELPTPDAMFRHPNSHKGQHFPSWPILGPGILFPIGTVYDALTYQYKADEPRLSPFDGRPIKYETCGGSRLVLHVPRRVRRWLKVRTRELWLTEGAKKALSGAGAGLCIVGLMGVDAWVVKAQPDLPGEPLPDWDEIELRGRLIFIAFDSDVMTKPEVAWSRRRLTAFLRKRGATVVPVPIPHGPDGSKQGLDDYIAARLAVGGQS